MSRTPPQPARVPSHYRLKKGTGPPKAALILGIFAVIPFAGVLPGLAAIALGIVSLVQKRPRRGMAIAGLVLGFALPTLTTTVTVEIYQARQEAKELAKEITCGANLRTIAEAANIYRTDYSDVWPGNLQVLIDEDLLGPDSIRCPLSQSPRESDYFYHPPADDASPMTLLACDWRGNHRSGRNVVHANGKVRMVSEQEFQQLLKKPENADFARALREAEGP